MGSWVALGEDELFEGFEDADMRMLVMLGLEVKAEHGEILQPLCWR